jgi:hypothetical protein
MRRANRMRPERMAAPGGTFKTRATVDDIHMTPHGDAVNDTARRRAASLRAALCGVILDRGGPAKLARANQ